MAKKVDGSENQMGWFFLFSVCFLTFVTRFHRVGEPDHVCWDETHFGKMGSWYINRTFFFDVHPPLGKMLIGLSGYLTGYDGTFPFDKPGDKYETASYLGMRVFCTALGASIVPMVYLTVQEMTKKPTAALFAAMLILFDVGLITLNQYILLDPILLCFMVGSILGAVKISYGTNREFTLKWWLWLTFTGVMLACCFAVKFVGLFVVLLVGFMTIADLWNILGDLSRPVMDTARHLMARALCLIVLPIILYVVFFYIHLSVLNESGNGDGFYSSAFQSQLKGNSLYNASMPRQVAYGSIITLKNYRTGGGYLHSHYHLYPEGVGARQQQITTYTHKDDNNKWLVKKYNEEKTDGVEIVRNGDLVRLEHVPTRRNLHAHKEHAPITKKHFQVTGYGENGTGDANDVWKIILVGGDDGAEITAVTSKLKFVHYLQSCVLTTSGKQLPKWAYEQQEVSCSPNLRDPNSLWNVEENVFDKLPSVNFKVYAPSFFERFVESHAVMFQGNAGLKPKEGEVTSRPWQWPLNYRGQFFSGSNYRIYLLGNPLIWWGNLIFLALFLMVFLAYAVRRQRGYIKSSEDGYSLHVKAAAWLFFGWLLHYVPFWGMGRVLYFHHYFPALIFSSMITGITIDYILESICDFFSAKNLAVVYHILVGSFLSILVYSFYLFSPLAYGMSGPTANVNNSTMYGLRWLESWEF